MPKLSDFIVGGSTAVPVIANDGFTANDPVFLDWKSGTTTNLNGALAGVALTAGPATSYFTAIDYATSTFASSTSVVLADGSIILAIASRLTTSHRLDLYKYSPKGVLQVKKPLVALSSTSIGSLCSTILSNGNIAFGYVTHGDTIKWAIISPSLQSVVQGTASTLTSYLYHIQAVTSGGFLLFTSTGLTTISSGGTVAAIVVAASITPAINDEINTNAGVSDNFSCPGIINYQPINISSNGFGYVYYNLVGVYYAQINADGTLRNTIATLQSWGSQGVDYVKYAFSSSGNIMWAVSLAVNAGYWGVVSSSGSVIKAGSLLTGRIIGGAALHLISDTNGGFVLITNDGVNWILTYTSSAGVDIPTSPGTLTTYGGLYAAGVVRLTTGIVFLSAVTSGYISKYSFIDLSGTIVVNAATLFNFGAGNAAISLGAIIQDDKVYGVLVAGSGAVADQAVFSIDNTGSMASSPVTLGVTLLPASPLRILFDSSAQIFHTVGSNTTQTVIISFDLFLNQLQSYTVAQVLSSAHIRNFGSALLFCDIGGQSGVLNTFLTATPANAAMFVKNKSTILLGVAASDATDGQTLVVNTKGLYPLPATWKTAAQNFDQSSNNPPGLKGWVNNSVISLGGF